MNQLEIFPGLEITNDRCAYLPAQRTVVLSDLHIGYESVMEQTGLHLPRIQTATMKDTLERIIEKRHPTRFIILGDLKHEFSRNLAQEWSEVRDLLGVLQERGEVVVVRGNHDNYLATIASKLGLELVDQLELGNIHFVHGHLDHRGRPLVMGHEHPSVRLFDTVGACIKMPCFVHLPKQRILVLPAFSPLAAGTDFTGMGKGGSLSPILADVDLSEAEAYGCSEIGLLHLGLLSDLTRSRHRGELPPF
jgi:hypothetical protein